MVLYVRLLLKPYPFYNLLPAWTAGLQQALIYCKTIFIQWRWNSIRVFWIDLRYTIENLVTDLYVYGNIWDVTVRIVPLEILLLFIVVRAQIQ